MSTYTARLRKLFRLLWTCSAPLTAVCWLMLPDTVIAAMGLALDSRQLAGVSVWMKPFKFAISTALYTGTLAWLCGLVNAKRAAWVTAVSLVIEIVIVDFQAARGVSSHFNNASRPDALLFSAMGGLIAVVWVAGIVVAIALFRHKFANAGWGWALRLGLAISLLGAATGGLMTVPTSAQMASLRAGLHTPVIGAHTVGAADGGPVIPLTGWSAEHGDLRVPHFAGLHAMQLIPLLAWWVGRRRVRVNTVFEIAACYGSLMVILAWQALRGQALIHPDGATLVALALWMAACMVVLTRAYAGRVCEATA